MGDLETRLADALRGAGERAPHPGDLAAPARDRLRRRRRTTGAVVAAVLLVVAVPLGLRLATGGSGAQVATVPADWRTESYRDLTLRVPADWTYEGGEDWCVAGPTLAEAAPAVERPGGLTRDIRCRPDHGYGVLFGDGRGDADAPPTGTPPGAAVDLVRTGQAHAWVVVESEDQLEQVLASATTIGELDANGCPATADFWSPEVDDEASVCHFRGGELQQSERLDTDQTDQLRAVVRGSQVVETGPEEVLCSSTESPELVVLVLDGSRLLVELPTPRGCGNGVVSLDGQTLAISEDLLFWALSPGWGGSLASSAPLPDPLRQD